MTLLEVELWNEGRRTRSMHQYVTDKRDFSAVRNDILQALRNFMSSRLAFDEDFDACISSMSSFLNFTATDDDIRKVLKTLCPDVDDVAELADSYHTVQLHLLQRQDGTKTSPPVGKSYQTAREVLEKLCERNAEHQQHQPAEDKKMCSLALTLSRILVCKPQSADCERLISAYNRLKTDARSSLTGEVVNDYVYILMNMPPIVQFDPRPAVLYWLSDKERRHKSTEKASKQDWFRHTFGFDAAQDADITETKEKRLLRKC